MPKGIHTVVNEYKDHYKLTEYLQSILHVQLMMVMPCLQPLGVIYLPLLSETERTKVSITV